MPGWTPASSVVLGNNAILRGAEKLSEVNKDVPKPNETGQRASPLWSMSRNSVPISLSLDTSYCVLVGAIYYGAFTQHLV